MKNTKKGLDGQLYLKDRVSDQEAKGGVSHCGLSGVFVCGAVKSHSACWQTKHLSLETQRVNHEPEHLVSNKHPQSFIILYLTLCLKLRGQKTMYEA